MSDGITRLLDRWNTGDPQAMQELLAAVYLDLRRLADGVLAHERAGHTLQPTALVHELYLRFSGLRDMHIDSRRHLYGAAASAMRRILVDHARARNYQKRGGGAKVSLDEALVVSDEPREDFVALNDALDALAAFDERKGRVIELRFFGGLTVEETAAILNVSPDTVMRDWRLAKSWLHREMRGSRHRDA